MENKQTGICCNCGADEGLHKYDTRQCPKNGIEEFRDGKKQQWEETIFEDSGLKNYQIEAVNNYERLKADNEVLVNALKNLLQSYRADFTNITGGILNDTESVKIAKEAIKQAENK